LNAAAAAEPQPASSPDASTVAFVAAAGGVHLVTVAGGASAPLAGSITGDVHPAYSPDGSMIAVIRPPAAICLIPHSGGDARCLPAPGALSGVDWTADGKRLVVSVAAKAGEPPGLSLVEIASGSVGALSPSPGAGDRWPVVSPRGGAVAFVRDGFYWVYELTGSPPSVRRTRKLSVRGSGPAGWATDSRFLYYTSDGRLLRLGFNATARPQLVGDVSDAVGQVAVARKGRSLVFARRTPEGSALFLMTGF
jgi:Tol biopolymer transport system component